MAEDRVFQSGYIEGVNKFQGVRAQAFWQEMLSLLRGKPAELLSFDDVKARLRLHEESYKGLQDIPLEQIVGSVGRYRDFTRSFLPRTSGMKDRWSRVYAKANSLEGLPPIEVYKVGDVYFVRDGNHRVSVARQLGATTIQGHVTELPTYIDVNPNMSIEDIDIMAAYAAFLEETELRRTRPHHQSMQLSEPSRYPELLGHVYLHARILEQVAGEPVSMADAAADWYDNVYRPAITLIRKYNVLDMCDDDGVRTEADLYLWMVDHLRDVRKQFGDEAKSRKFSHALVDFLSSNKIAIPRDLIHEEDDTVTISRTQVMRALNLKQQQNEA